MRIEPIELWAWATAICQEKLESATVALAEFFSKDVVKTVDTEYREERTNLNRIEAIYWLDGWIDGFLLLRIMFW